MKLIEKLADEWADRHPSFGGIVDEVRIPFHRAESYEAGFRKALALAENEVLSVDCADKRIYEASRPCCAALTVAHSCIRALADQEAG